MNLKALIQENQESFLILCKQHQVEKLYAFGSSITDRFNPNTSDLDFVVDISIENPLDRGEALLSFWNELELLFKRKVDLLTENSIHNPVLRKSIDSTKKLIYDRKGEKVFS